MPRQARVVAVDVPHHITHRGNNRQDVFLSDEDRCRYQSLLRDKLGPCGLDLLGWCWMTNHIHLIAVPRNVDALSRLVMRVHSRYAQEFNRKYKRSGHLWHSRFYSCALGPSHVQAALLYVVRNPVRAGMVGEATAWKWSSASAHIQREHSNGLLSWSALDVEGGCSEWEARLQDPIDAKATTHLRQATQSGKPMGSEEFVKGLEHKLGLHLRSRPTGRPKKALAASAGNR